jgi:crotonobetainyl-CoA:carnitine CoA-transferase CaiB-like acyl-CoA transferase
MGAGAFEGVRVVEVSVTPAGRIAGMLLADLGAEVIRVTGEERGVPDAGRDPGPLCWDRGKSIVNVDPGSVPGLSRAADVLLVDHTPGLLRSSGLEAAMLRRGNPRLVHLWMPPYATHGEWSELPADPILLAALGVAGHYPSSSNRPVAPVAATTDHVHGAMGATAAAAGLVGRLRQGGGSAVVVSGLHAVAAQMASMMSKGLDQPVFSPSTSERGAPCWRPYRCADGRWFFLAALTPEIFFRALDVLDRMDIMVLPEVAGEFSNILIPDAGGRVVVDELEALFASRPAHRWLDMLTAGGVPCAPIRTRSEWLGGEVIEANRGTVVREHELLGPVTMPGVPVALSRTPGSVGEFPEGASCLADLSWTEAPSAPGRPSSRLPLAGLKVVDTASFLAAPFVASLLADLGADVVKVEPPAGDPYRAYPIAFLAINQLKRGIVLDLNERDGAEALLALVRGADVLVENMRPGRLERMGLAPERIREEHPGLVHCSVSAYGQAGRFADAPGFDPVFQALSGMAAAQGGGGDGEPIMSAMPAHDTCTGVLGAFGVLAALYARGHDGLGQRVAVSLAATSTFLQSAEFTTYKGRPDPAQGGRDFPGPRPGNRYYQCSDGWIAIAAGGSEAQPAALLQALGLDAVDQVEAALRTHTVRRAARLLAGHGVPACRVVMREKSVDDPFLVENGFSRVVEEPGFGRVKVVSGYSDWGTVAGRVTPAAFTPGQHGREVLAEAGYDGARVRRLLGG